MKHKTLIIVLFTFYASTSLGMHKSGHTNTKPSLFHLITKIRELNDPNTQYDKDPFTAIRELQTSIRELKKERKLQTSIRKLQKQERAKKRMEIRQQTKQYFQPLFKTIRSEIYHDKQHFNRARQRHKEITEWLKMARQQLELAKKQLTMKPTYPMMIEKQSEVTDLQSKWLKQQFIIASRLLMIAKQQYRKSRQSLMEKEAELQKKYSDSSRSKEKKELEKLFSPLAKPIRQTKQYNKQETAPSPTNFF